MNTKIRIFAVVLQVCNFVAQIVRIFIELN
ncbi:Uncharacterised protein [Mycobacteroides abscessus subsp. bolletii]|nr:Uncharacterised protein [Mycobacteroides abscessus subsp. bolletii]SKH07617.1 Uncharacterised protein [Mycobacteroides abscessus subsp. bolletii]